KVNCHKCSKYGHKGCNCQSSGNGKDNEEGKAKGKQKGKQKTKMATAATMGLIKSGLQLLRTQTELYDSGASCHMSSYRDQFINFKSIAPKPITAADKCTFQAIGTGDMLIHLPDGKSHSSILLKDILNAPMM
ncbi:hypothetical protein PAXRUDRAFT_78054, partial [Paxillus rubicundulus Ve08.2h10]